MNKEQGFEKGSVIDVKENNITFDENWNVFKDNFHIGNIGSELKWFDKSKLPQPEEINEIVYLDDFKWGLKQLTSKREEFELLNDFDKEQVLEDFLETVASYIYLQEELYNS